jgi:hypothetical protein
MHVNRVMINFLKQPVAPFIRPPANYYVPQHQQNRMPMNYNQPMMVPINHQVYQPQQRPSLIIQQPNVVPKPTPNPQYISYNPNTGGYQQQPQPNYPPPSTYINFNSYVPNWQPQQPQRAVVTNIPQIPQQQPKLPLKRERKPIIITDQNTHELVNFKDKVKQKTKQTTTSTTQFNDDYEQSVTTSTNNRNINSQEQQKSTASTITSAPISTNTQEVKALQLEFSLSVLKKINESFYKKTLSTNNDEKNDFVSRKQVNDHHGLNGLHNLVPQHDVQLPKTKISNKPFAQLDETEKVLRGIRANLNKLTPQNFQKLVGDLVNLEINADDNRIRRTVDIIFENSIKEPKLSAIYANLCKALNMVNNF